MPYINANDGRREALRNGEPALTAGELNYQLFYYAKHADYIDELRVTDFVDQFLGDKPNYQKWNDMTGCLIRCYKEIQRRLHVYIKYTFISVMDSYDDEIAKYEDIKINFNGDVE